MNLDDYDDKSPRWLTSGEVPPVELWAEHFLRPAKKRNIIYTKYLELRLAVYKAKYNFLSPEQIYGIALRELNVPSLGFKINQHFLDRYKMNRRQSTKGNSKLWRVNPRSYCLFEDADMSSNADDDFHLQMRAPSPPRKCFQRMRAASPPSECFQNESIYDDLNEMFEDVQIQPFKSLTRRTRPSDICPNENRKNIKSTKDNRLLNQFEIFKDLSNYGSELLPNRNENSKEDADVIFEKISVTNRSILKSNSCKENSKHPNFEKSVQFNENLEEIHEYQPFEENDSSTIEYRSPIFDDDVEGNLRQEDSTETFLDSSLNESSSAINEKHVNQNEIFEVDFENENTFPQGNIEVPAPRGEEQDNVDKNQHIGREPLNVDIDEENHNTSPSNITNQSITEIVTEAIVEECYRDETLLIETSQTESFMPCSQDSLNESIILNSLEDNGTNKSASHILFKNKLNEKLDFGTINAIQEDGIHHNSLKSDVAATEQDMEEADHNLKEIEPEYTVQNLSGETVSGQSDNDLENDSLCNSIFESDIDGEVETMTVTLNNCGMIEQDRSSDVDSNSQNTDVSFEGLDLENSVQNEITVENSRVESDINDSINYDLSKAIDQSVTVLQEVADEVNDDIGDSPASSPLEEYRSMEIQRRLISEENMLHEELMNECSYDKNFERKTRHFESSSIAIRPAENNELLNECSYNKNKSPQYFESMNISIRPADTMINDDNSNLFQKPHKREQRFYESTRISICSTNSITDNENKEDKVPTEEPLKRDQRYNYDSGKIPIRPGNKLIKNSISYGESCASSQTDNIPEKKQNQNLKSIANEKQPSYFQSSTIPIRPEEKRNCDRKIESMNLPEDCRNKNRLSYFNSIPIPIHPRKEDECSTGEQLSSQLLRMESQTLNEHFDRNSNSSSETSGQDDTARKVTRKRNFSSIFGTSISNMNSYLTGNGKVSPKFGIGSLNGDETSQHSTNYDLSLEEMMNCNHDDEPSEKVSTLKTIDRNSSFNIPSLDDDYQIINSDDSLAAFCNALRKNKQNLGAEVGGEEHNQFNTDDDSLASSLEFVMNSKRRKRDMNTEPKQNTLQHSNGEKALASQTTSITEDSSRSIAEMKKIICTNWLAENDFFKPNLNWLGTGNPSTEFNVRIPDPVEGLPIDNGGEGQFNKLPDIEFSSSEY